MDDEPLRITRRATLLGSAAAGVAAALPRSVRAAASGIAARIDVGQTGPALSPLLFGGFLEHLRGVITDCYWSELLADRKFYYPVSSAPPAPPPRAAGGPPGAPPRRWQPLGPDSAITMDTQAPYVGEHSPAVQLAVADARGIAQSGLALLAGQDYTGRIVIAADRDAEVVVSLIWGAGPNARQSVRVPAASDWRTVPLHVQGRRRHQRRAPRDQRHRCGHFAHRRRLADAGRQRSRASAPTPSR